MEPVGNTWLRQRFGLTGLPLSHESYIGPRLSTTTNRDGKVVRTFTRQYQPEPPDAPFAHVEFALKYDRLDLALLHAVFRAVAPSAVAEFVGQSPSGRYARQIGFLFEFLTGSTLDHGADIAGNYVPVLDPERYLTAAPRKVPRWRVDDNLLGSPEFSPVIRRTEDIDAGIRRDWRGDIANTLAGTPAPLLYRALSYFYAKETRSSFLIEREEPGRGREQRFIAALRDAGRVPAEESVSPTRLVALQNAIVDPRYAERAFRTLQNYVGQTMPGMREQVHYIPPPPELVSSLMAGLAAAVVRMEPLPPTAQAAVTGFQFVFIHPFEDGNGRIHRFLLHDVLARRGVVQLGTALPLSATILADMPAYDAALEAFSRGIMARATFSMGTNGRIMLENASQMEAMWRFPDLTPQVEYLHRVIDGTIRDLPRELAYLRRYDRAREEIRGIVDMPDQRLSSLLRWLDEGGGRLSNNKRKQFDELSDDEVARVQAAYADAFSDEGETGGSGAPNP